MKQAFSFVTFDSFLASLGRNSVYDACCSAQTAQFKRVQQSRQQALRAYCPKLYILCPKEKEELNDLNDAIKKSANRIREALKIQQDNIQKNKEQNDQKIRLTQVQAQTKQFQKVWNEYNDSQLDFRKESKTTLIRQAKITGNIHLTDEKVEEMIDKGTVYISG